MVFQPGTKETESYKQQWEGIFQDIGIFFLNGCLGVGEVVKKVNFCSAIALVHTS